MQANSYLFFQGTKFYSNMVYFGMEFYIQYLAWDSYLALQLRVFTYWGNKRTSFHYKIKTAIESGNELINKREGSRMGIATLFIRDSGEASQLRERFALDDVKRMFWLFRTPAINYPHIPFKFSILLKDDTHPVVAVPTLLYLPWIPKVLLSVKVLPAAQQVASRQSPSCWAIAQRVLNIYSVIGEMVTFTTWKSGSYLIFISLCLKKIRNLLFVGTWI